MKFAYTTPDGGVAIVYAAKKQDLERDLSRPLTDKEYRDFVVRRSIPAGVEFVEIKNVPSDRTNRDKWRLMNGTIQVVE